VSYGLVKPLQENDERIVRLSLRLRSHLSGQCQGGQSSADCSFSVDHFLVGERREIHDSLPPGSDSPLRLEQGSYRSEKRGPSIAEARSCLARVAMLRELAPPNIRPYRARIR
jgi:hypothetical protein